MPGPDKPLSRRNNRKITFDAACRKMLFEIAKRHGLDLEEEAEYGNRKYLEKCLQSGTGTRQHLESFFEQHGQVLRPDIELPTTDLIVPLVEQNLGIGIVPENFAAHALEQQSIFSLRLRTPFPFRQIGVVTCLSHPLSLAAQQFLKMLVEKGDF